MADESDGRDAIGAGAGDATWSSPSEAAHGAAKPEGDSDAKDGKDDKGKDDKKGKTGDGKSKGDGKDEAKDDEGEDGGDAKDDESPPKPLKERPGLLIGGAIVIILLIVGGVLWWLHARQFESTDDAYVDGHIVRVAPQVAGVLRQMLVDDNQIVGPNQLLAVVDSAQPQARYQGLVAQAQRARATVVQSQAQVALAARQIATAEANVRRPQADLDKAEADLARYNALLKTEPGAVAGQQIDAAIQTVRAARAQRDAARKQVDETRAQLKSAEAAVGANRAAVVAADADTKAQGVDLAFSRIVAPSFGRIANRNASVGSYVQPGQEILAIVPLKLWVTANFKETQLKLMRVGQPVDIRIDTIPDVEFHGHVGSFQRGAGQAFALLPSENATGNFVKVVQRVPVKIVIDSPGIEGYPVGPGMSVTPTVKVR